MTSLFRIATPLLFLFLLMGNRPVPQWIPEWNETSSLPAPRGGTAVVAAGGYLYVMGGTNGNHFLKDTLYAKIKKDGSLGPWKQGPSLNEARGHFAAVIYKGSLYVVGGASGPNGSVLSRTIERAKIKKDGSLSPWVLEKQGLNMPRRCSKGVSLGGSFITLGGYGGDLLNTVEHAAFNKDGSLDEWFEEEEKLTMVRYISGVKKVGDAVYVVGGHHPLEGKGVVDVEWSTVKDVAGFSKWQNASPLNTGRYGLATAVHGKTLYAIGGASGDRFMASIEKSEVEGEGKLAPWEFTTSLRNERASFSTAVYKDHIYVIGGANANRFIDSIEYATFNEAGDIGHYATSKEAAAYLEKRKAEEAKIAASHPNRGIVTQVIQAKRYKYTYLEVKEKDTTQWMAAPVVDVNVGATIRYGGSLTMSNFYSKDLNRKFPFILLLTSPIKIIKR